MMLQFLKEMWAAIIFFILNVAVLVKFPWSWFLLLNVFALALLAYVIIDRWRNLKNEKEIDLN